VPSRCRNLKCPLGLLLAHHILKVLTTPGLRQKDLLEVHLAGGDVPATEQEFNHLGEMACGIDLNPLDNRAFGGVFHRDHQSLSAPGFGCEGKRKNPPAAPHRSIERELSDQGIAFEDSLGHHSRGAQYGSGDGEVKTGPLLLYVRRGQVDGNPLGWKGIAAVFYRSLHPLAAFPHRVLREPDDIEAGQSW